MGDGEVRRGPSRGVETLLSRSVRESSRTERNWDQRRDFSGRTLVTAHSLSARRRQVSSTR